MIQFSVSSSPVPSSMTSFSRPLTDCFTFLHCPSAVYSSHRNHGNLCKVLLKYFQNLSVVSQSKNKTKFHRHSCRTQPMDPTRCCIFICPQPHYLALLTSHYLVVYQRILYFSNKPCSFVLQSVMPVAPCA